jgi:hypothetical protein
MGTSIAFTHTDTDGIDQNVDIFITNLADGVTRQLINDVGAGPPPCMVPRWEPASCSNLSATAVWRLHH